MDLHAHLVESCENCRMGVAPHTSCPLPREMSIAEQHLQMLSTCLCSDLMVKLCWVLTQTPVCGPPLEIASTRPD